MFNPSDIDARFEDLQTKRAEDCFYESLSVIASSPDADRAVELRFAVASRGPTWADRTVEFSFLAMTRNGQAWFSVERFRWNQWALRRGLLMETQGLKFTPNHCKGGLGDNRWDILIGGGSGSLPLLPGKWRMYRDGADHLRQYTHQANLKLAGEIQLGTETWDLEGWTGHRPHVWGESLPRSTRLAVHAWQDGLPRALEAAVGPLDIAPGFSSDHAQRGVLRGPELERRWMRTAAPAEPGSLKLQGRGVVVSVQADDLLPIRSMGPHGDVLRQVSPFARVQVSGDYSGASQAGWLEHLSDDADRAPFPPVELAPRLGSFSIHR
jgi:hypothetical protein